jgi:hypothetical protein
LNRTAQPEGYLVGYPESSSLPHAKHRKSAISGGLTPIVEQEEYVDPLVGDPFLPSDVAE